MLIAAADAGSLAKGAAGNFGWSATDRHGRSANGRTPDVLVQYVAEAVAAGEQIALGFECPLAVPVRDDFTTLGEQRDGESGRPWSAGAGAAALATGLVQLAWVLRHLPGVGVTVLPGRWSERKPVLLWEAFVSGALKLDRSPETGHVADAEAAVRGFAALARPLPAAGRIHLGEHKSVNLAVAAALAAGCVVDPDEMSAPILVVDGV